MTRLLGRLPIAVRVPLMGAAMMLLAGLVASQQVLTALTRTQEARLEELTRQHVSGLSLALGPAVLRQDIWDVFDTLDRAARAGEDHRMVLTVVANDDGTVIAASDPRRAPVDSALSDQFDLGAVPALDEISLARPDIHMRVQAPLTYQGRTVGRLVSELDVADLIDERRRAALVLLVFNTAATGALALLGYFVMRHMLRPVDFLARRMSTEEGRPARFTEAEIPDGDTEVARLFRTYNDMIGAVEEKADAERRLAERERLVSLGRLSSSLAHEINNPLGGLLNAADTIESYADRPDAVRRSAALLKRGLEHLRDVTKAALDHNRIEDRAASLSAQDLEDMRLLVLPEVRRMEQDLGWRVEAAESSLAPYPAGPVRQIVLNLLLNAISAAGRGGSVSFAVQTRPGGVQLDILDDGPGLSAAARDRLMTSAPASAAGGLGLRVVREMVNGLSGRIESARQDGVTRISITLPFAEPEDRS
jgi:signal transduction histidine kinase